MATPFKMKGHTLPGIKQKKSPMHIDPITLSALIGAGVSIASKGVKGIAAKKAAKKAEEGAKKKEARDAATAGADAASVEGSKTKLTD